MFSKALEESLNAAFARAREKSHEFMTVEHLLLALLDNCEANEVLVACGADLDRLRAGLGIFIDETTPQIPVGASREIQPTLGFQRVLQRAIFQVQSAGKSEVNGANVLAAIFGEQESQAVYFLSQENITRLDVVNYISHGTSSISGRSSLMDHEEEADHAMGGDISGRAGMGAMPTPGIGVPGTDIPGGQKKETVLDRYTVNLNRLAQEGKIDPLIGRHDEIMRAIQVLSRRRKNNPLFVGEAGVGKTAMAEGLAQLIVENNVPNAIANCVVYALDLGVLLAGTKYRGDFEKRFKAVLQELKNTPNSIVFIDEIHTIIGAGAASGGTMDASNLLKPLLASGEIRCMGSTTYHEYRNIFEKDRALTRRFQKIDLEEPSVEDTIKILRGLKAHFEAYHSVKYTLPALRAAARLTARYITDRHLPDKAIDVVDEAGAYQQLQSESKRKKIIGRKEIEQMVAKLARIPSQHVSLSDKEVLRNLETELKTLVFGQDHAIEQLCSAIKLSRSGLRENEKPVGSFLFAGPTGVGKTEVTRQLAKSLNIELIRFDMSEYMEAHTVSRLIGAPPGYVGYDQGGLLTEAVSKQPHAVLLLDEIEKAHPDVYNLLLQVMDTGKLTDNNGRSADFRHIIIVMTTNEGAEQLEKSSVGFTENDESMDSIEAIKRRFTPEFRNRLDAIVPFNHLDRKTVALVVDKFMAELEVQLEEKNVKLNIDDSVKEWLIENGFDKKLGARPMSRVIQQEIKKPLAEEILFGELENGGVVRLQVKNNGIALQLSEKEKT